MTLIRSTAFFFLMFIVQDVAAQDYYINEKDKKTIFAYYFKVMDSLVLNNPNDTAFFCINCVRFMQHESKMQSSGKTTYFGRFDFSRQDLEKWHRWYVHRFKSQDEFKIWNSG